MNKRTKSNSIRLIAGQWRGRRLPVLHSEGLRPTTDRVRETVFNWLMHDVSGANCLDLFAGTGALGLECLSRGAASVQFVESDKHVHQVLKDNLEALKAGENVSLLNTSGLAFLNSAPSQRFDLVFLDPPFGSNLLEQAIELLHTKDWLADNALVYIEQSSVEEPVPIPQHWKPYRESKAGQSRFSLYAV